MPTVAVAWAMLLVLVSNLNAAPASPDGAGDVNVALRAMGSHAEASSSYGSNYDAGRAIDGKWENRETDKWNSAAGPGPHWIIVDFGQPRKIYKVIIRHEGVFGDGDLYNTRDFAIQSGLSKNGPWKNLVPPITGNTRDITIHPFAPAEVRFLRLFITQGERDDNLYARIYEIEACARKADVPRALRNGFANWQAQSALSYPARVSNGEVRILSSSHQDTAWIDTPDFCRQFRIEHVLLPALEMMRRDTNYTFSMEGTLHLMELMQAHPELREEVRARMKEGRLEFGATYNEPYESWLSGEELVRELYYGRRWIHKNFPGCDATVDFNPDPPGRSLQMQQILSKAGVPYLFISRFHLGLHRWRSPDGSSVLAYSPGHYGNDLDILEAPYVTARRDMAERLNQWASGERERRAPPEFCLINSMDFTQPRDFSSFITAWNTQPIKPGSPAPPSMRYSSFGGFFEAVDKPAANYNALRGERPDIWVYITGPSHHWMDSAKREAARLLPAAEMFTTFDCLLQSNFSAWPSREFDGAWMDELYPDHGLGGKNGQISDAIFYQKVQQARDTGRKLLDIALSDIASQTSANVRLGTPVVIFNDLSWPRTDDVELTIPEKLSGGVAIVDSSGHEVPSQLVAAGQSDEVNVAEPSAGATAAASSIFGPGCGPNNAILGEGAGEWCSATNALAVPWIAIDFGQSRAIHKVVIRHEGALGVYGKEVRDNTSDFEIQGSDSAAGPWTNLVAPVIGNRASLTAHLFEPKTVRCLRLLIHRGSQPDGEPGARIRQIEAFSESPSPSRKLVFVAQAVPPLGYKTYYLAQRPSSPSPLAEVKTSGAENGFYRLALAPGGVRSLYDKQLGRELLRNGNLLGGEVFTMTSVAETNRSQGTDAGEFVTVPLPVMDATFDHVARHRPQWKLLENGPVRAAYELEQSLSNVQVRQRVLLWHGMKRVDFEVDLIDFNGELWREFRMALPLAIDQPKIVYEVPMGTVEIGKDEIPTNGGLAIARLNYSQPCREIHPRQMQDFVDVSGAGAGITMTSSVSVFDWVDPTTNAPAEALLQPVLLASRKSCNHLGVWYPQAGNHFFRFPVTSHAGDWREGWKSGIAANHPLIPVFPGSATARLPEEMSFASIDAENVVVTAIKKAEDDDAVIVRACEMEGRDSPVALRFLQPMKTASHTSIIEEDARPARTTGGRLEFQPGHNSIETYRLHF